MKTASSSVLSRRFRDFTHDSGVWDAPCRLEKTLTNRGHSVKHQFRAGGNGRKKVGVRDPVHGARTPDRLRASSHHVELRRLDNSARVNKRLI
ncbi:hypothetical protein ElyMa_005913000 [Elysia marginata]|uniref:60S ribosomal protein L28 n=1 Tax=Elysia marginata TaxID=1093978 RepID=A0AAV4G6Z5_9GAST|nr:hypothetical protein ElyMa_005913000 [Elysia marginata]